MDMRRRRQCGKGEKEERKGSTGNTYFTAAV